MSSSNNRSTTSAYAYHHQQHHQHHQQELGDGRIIDHHHEHSYSSYSHSISSNAYETNDMGPGYVDQDEVPPLQQVMQLPQSHLSPMQVGTPTPNMAQQNNQGGGGWVDDGRRMHVNHQSGSPQGYQNARYTHLPVVKPPPPAPFSSPLMQNPRPLRRSPIQSPTRSPLPKARRPDNTSMNAISRNLIATTVSATGTATAMGPAAIQSPPFHIDNTQGATVDSATRTSEYGPKRTISDTFSSGREFYDDGYSETEQNMSELPQNISSMIEQAPFFERQTEMEDLKAAFRRWKSCQSDFAEDRVSKYASQLPIVFVGGTSGTGKSRLAQEFVDFIQQDSRGADDASIPFVVRGKFDEQYDAASTATSMFSGIIQAMDHLVAQIHRQQHHLDDDQINSLDGSTYDLNQARFAIQTTFSDQASTQRQRQRQRQRQMQRQTGGPVPRNLGAAPPLSPKTKVNASAMVGLCHAIPSLSIFLWDDIPDSHAGDSDEHGSTAAESLSHEPETTNVDEPRSSTKAPRYKRDKRHSKSLVSISSYHDQSEHGDGTNKVSSNSSSVAISNQYQYNFVQFLRTICTEERPLILLLEDLQWCSEACLDLISLIIKDADLKHCFIVATIRDHEEQQQQRQSQKNWGTPDTIHEHAQYSQDSQSNQEQSSLTSTHVRRHTGSAPRRRNVNSDTDRQSSGQLSLSTDIDSNATHHGYAADHPLSRFLKRIRHISKRQRKRCTSISLCALPYEHFQIWLSELLGRNDIDELSEPLYSKTHGNWLFMMQALEQLERHNCLVYSRIFFQWEWNFNHVKAEDGDPLPMIADSVVQMMTLKLQQLSCSMLRCVLTVASYLQRSEFHIYTLLAILHGNVLEGHDDGHIEHGPASCNGTTNGSATANGSASAMESLSISQLQQILDGGVKEKVLKPSVSSELRYAFAHDRIQQAAYELIEYGEERNRMRGRIGKRIIEVWKQCEANEELREFQTETDNTDDIERTILEDEALLFVAADHINSAPSKDHLYITTLNTEIGELALSKAALSAASIYLQNAHRAWCKLTHFDGQSNQALDRASQWVDHYDLTLRLFETRSKVELGLGNLSLGREMAQLILSNARCLSDKLPTYLALSASLGRENLLVDAFESARSPLVKAGMFPARFYMVHFLRDMGKIKSFFRNVTDDEILGLPRVTDTETVYSFRLLQEIAVRAILIGEMVQFLAAVGKLVRWIMKNGINGDCGYTLAVYALITSTTGDHEGSVRFANLAHRILDEIPGNNVRAGWVYLTNNLYVYSIYKDPVDIIASYQQGYRVSMGDGDFETGFLNWQLGVMHAYTTSCNLGQILTNGESMLNQATVYRVEGVIGMGSEIIRLIRFLASSYKEMDWESFKNEDTAGEGSNKGSNNDDTIKSTTDQDSLEETSTDETDIEMSESDLKTRATFRFWAKTQMALMFFQYELAEAFIKKYWEASAHDKSYENEMWRPFLSGLIASGLYRKTRRPGYRMKLRKMYKALKKMLSIQGCNCRDRCLLLKAELVSLQGGKLPHKVLGAYNLAIQTALHHGQVQTAALGCELAGEHFLRSKKEQHIGNFFQRALYLYKDWGCVAKAEYLQECRSIYIDPMSSRVSRSSMPHNRVPQQVLLGPTTN